MEMDIILLLLVAAVTVVFGEECLVETQKCNFPFSSPGSGELHYSCQATDNSSSGKYFCRSQVGEEGQVRHTYGICNGGCFDLDGLTPMVFSEDDFIMASMCSTAGSPCRFPFTWQEKEYLTCTTDGVDQFPWCALEVDDNGVLVKDRWGKCDMSTCAEEVKDVVEVEPMEAVAEFKDSVIGVVMISQQAPDNPLDVRGKIEGLPQGHFNLRVDPNNCEEEAGRGEGIILNKAVDSDGKSDNLVSSQDWKLTLYPGHTSREYIVGRSLVIEKECQTETNQGCDNLVWVSCTNIILKSEQTTSDNTMFLIIILVVIILFLILLLCICIYCCFRSRREKHKIPRVEEVDQGSVEEEEDIYLGSRSKSPLFDELSIPFIDASLPPTPKTNRSQNALEILLGGSIGSSASISDRDA